MIELFVTNASWLAKVMSVVMWISPVIECDVVTSNKVCSMQKLTSKVNGVLWSKQPRKKSSFKRIKKWRSCIPVFHPYC